MTVERLKQFRSLKKEIQELTEEINKHKTHEVVKASSLCFPYTEGVAHIDGIPLTKEVRRLQARKNRCILECQEIREFIDNIADSQLRRIFTYRYLQGGYKVSWQKVAMLINEYDESYPRRKHNRYLSRNN